MTLFRSVSLVFCLLVSTGTGQQASPDEPPSMVSSLDRVILDDIHSKLERTGQPLNLIHAASDAFILDTVKTLPPEEMPEILFGVSTVVLARMAHHGLLEPTEMAWAQELPVGLADRDRRWHALFAEPLVIVYNLDYYEEDDLMAYRPEGWEDLSSSRFFGSLLMERPTPFNETGYLIASLVDRADREPGGSQSGFELLYEIDRNLFRIYNNIDVLLSPAALFAGGDGSISVSTLRRFKRCEEQGMAAGFIVPSEGIFLYPRGIALVKGAGEAARALYRSLTDKDFLRELSARHAFYPLAKGEADSLSLVSADPVPLDIIPSDHDSIQRNISGWISEWQNRIHGKAKNRTKTIDDAINMVMILLIPAALIFVIINSRTREQRRQTRRPEP